MKVSISNQRIALNMAKKDVERQIVKGEKDGWGKDIMDELVFQKAGLIEALETLKLVETVVSFVMATSKL